MVTSALQTSAVGKLRENGRNVIAPIEFIETEEISHKTLLTMDEAILNYKFGNVSEPVDLTEF